jgi:hypothetical protein
MILTATQIVFFLGIFEYGRRNEHVASVYDRRRWLWPSRVPPPLMQSTSWTNWFFEWWRVKLTDLQYMEYTKQEAQAHSCQQRMAQVENNQIRIRDPFLMKAEQECWDESPFAEPSSANDDDDDDDDDEEQVVVDVGNNMMAEDITQEEEEMRERATSSWKNGEAVDGNKECSDLEAMSDTDTAAGVAEPRQQYPSKRRFMDHSSSERRVTESSYPWEEDSEVLSSRKDRPRKTTDPTMDTSSAALMDSSEAFFHTIDVGCSSDATPPAIPSRTSFASILRGRNSQGNDNCSRRVRFDSSSNIWSPRALLQSWRDNSHSNRNNHDHNDNNNNASRASQRRMENIPVLGSEQGNEWVKYIYDAGKERHPEWDVEAVKTVSSSLWQCLKYQILQLQDQVVETEPQPSDGNGESTRTLGSECKEKEEEGSSEPKQDMATMAQKNMLKRPLAAEDAALLKCIGLDSFMMLRFLTLGADVAFWSLLMACILLLPAYKFGGGNGQVGFYSATIVNLPKGDALHWWVVLYGFVQFAYILRRLWIEWEIFIPLRHDFLENGEN